MVLLLHGDVYPPAGGGHHTHLLQDWEAPPLPRPRLPALPHRLCHLLLHRSSGIEENILLDIYLKNVFRLNIWLTFWTVGVGAALFRPFLGRSWSRHKDFFYLSKL